MKNLKTSMVLTDNLTTLTIPTHIQPAEDHELLMLELKRLHGFYRLKLLQVLGIGCAALEATRSRQAEISAPLTDDPGYPGGEPDRPESPADGFLSVPQAE